MTLLKRITALLVISITLTANVQDAPAQSQLISAGLSLFSNITGNLGFTLTGEAAADAQELYNLVTNWKCLKSKFNFYMSFIVNNNDCNFNINRQKVQDQMNILNTKMIQAGQNAFAMIKDMFPSSSGSNSQTAAQQIGHELKSVVEAVNDIQQFVDLVCEAIRVANNNQFMVQVSGACAGHEISINIQSVL